MEKLPSEHYPHKWYLEGLGDAYCGLAYYSVGKSSKNLFTHVNSDTIISLFDEDGLVVVF